MPEGCRTISTTVENKKEREQWECWRSGVRWIKSSETQPRCEEDGQRYLFLFKGVICIYASMHLGLGLARLAYRVSEK